MLVPRPSDVLPLVRIALLLILLGAGLCASLLGQNVVLTGTISGRVVDASGAVVQEATVVVRNLGTGVQLSALSNRNGLYQFPALRPGTYSVTTSVQGFRDVSALVRVTLGNNTVQDIRLQPGASTEAVKVVATTPLLRPAESSASTVLERSLTEDLPLDGRKYTDFMMLTPNTSYDGDTGLVSMAGQQGGEDSGYANGNGSSYFTVDGSNATSNYFADIVGRYRIPYLYGEDSIEEFQVAVSPYSAIYGGGAGFVNAVTRSGSNELHGSVFYYNRNSALGANDALDESVGNPKPADSLQQFGAGLGGPLVKNRAWFFVDYEQQLRNNPISVINQALVSTQPGFLSSNFGVPDGTTLPAPNGALPIPGQDTTPDPSNAVYLQQVSNAINALNSNLGTKPRSGNDLVVTPRLDYQATTSDSFFLSLNFNRFSSPGGVITEPTGGNYGLQTLANAYVHTFQTSLGWTHAFSHNLLNEFHAGTSQDNELSTPTGLAPNTPTIVLDSPAAFTLGNAPFSIGKVFERQYSLADRIDYIVGKHTLQFGFDWNRAWDADTNDGGADPNEAIDFGSPLGLYEFPNLEAFALGQYINFSQAAGNSNVFVCRSLLRVLCAGYIPGSAPADARTGIARGLPGVSPACGKSGVPAHRAVSQPVPAVGSAHRIRLATNQQNGRARRIRPVLHQHERPELPQRGRLQRSASQQSFISLNTTAVCPTSNRQRSPIFFLRIRSYFSPLPIFLWCRRNSACPISCRPACRSSARFPRTPR